ncbi:MAG: aldo/keto reductase [Pseudomonadales bacterium]|jgi:aryl-alcohol dehydrogenase-like predicted oxidoreductase|nr:aldo/keto reductase [Pseudomonadales bacterium]
MNFLRPLGNTGLTVSALGLGTVKFGRNQGVKYPSDFALPSDEQIRSLLHQARELGINLLDTAPAYGSAEARLGQLLTDRHQWVLATKVGEEFENGVSHFDFSAAHFTRSIERSLTRLRTDYLDLVLIHSDGNDRAILDDAPCLTALRQCQQAGKVRAIGMSSKTLDGGILAAQALDVVMLTWNLQQQDRAVAAEAARLNKGVLVKKGLMSGHVVEPGRDLVAESLKLILSENALHSLIVGTLSPEHLRQNVAKARAVLVG